MTNLNMNSNIIARNPKNPVVLIEIARGNSGEKELHFNRKRPLADPGSGMGTVCLDRLVLKDFWTPE